MGPRPHWTRNCGVESSGVANIVQKTMCAVVFGTLCSEHVSWEELGRKFRMNVVLAANVQELQETAQQLNVIAVLVEMDLLQAIRGILPDARWIVCHPMSCEPAAEQLDAIGAFHAIPYPLSFDEVRHSLGFAWVAATRRKPAKVRAISAA